MKADVLRCGFLLSDAEAIGIYELCMRHFICLEVEEIPRELNEKAYELSKFVCKDDYKLCVGVLYFRWFVGPTHNQLVCKSSFDTAFPFLWTVLVSRL